ncbi:hypothetical protein, partial [Jiulongibacter sediminis]|uniref:hypothetical protein n=1 Tax=Jiulongibacter sediminis TaxID=1605367 RepID=UPI0026F248BD
MKEFFLDLFRSIGFEIFSGVEVIFGFLTFLVSAFTAGYLLWKDYRIKKLTTKYKIRGTFEEKLNASIGITSPKPIALAISFTTNTVSIRDDVKNFLIANNMKMPIEP